LLVCDYRQGAIRGYADFEADAVDEIGANASLAALFGEGHLAITFDLEQGGRYQGIVPLEGDSLAAATQDYFARSEQVPTLIRVAVTGDSRTMRAGGLLVQHMADGEEGRERLHVRMDHPNWEHIAVMGGSVRHAELLDEELSLDAILWRLFHEEEEVRIAPGPPLSRGCRCTVEHYQDVLGRFSEEDRKDMRGDDGLISVDCAFCSKVFAIAA
jgi:molecular chaperone Hsp33